jgi:hypothetical protein
MPAAPHSYFLRITKITDLILAGRTQPQMTETIVAAIDKKNCRQSGAMCYMMSKQGYAGDSTEHWPPHLMFSTWIVTPQPGGESAEFSHLCF